MRTVVEALERAAREATWGHTFVRSDGSEREVTFSRILSEARAVGRGLLSLGLRRGDRVALVTPDPEEFVTSFYGAMCAGLVPVPLYPPATMTKLESYAATLGHVLRTAEAHVLVAPEAQREMLQGLVRDAGTATRFVDYKSIPKDIGDEIPLEPPAPDEIGLLQFTSGSTSAPKGVAITHGQLAANAHAIMVDGLRSTAEDRGVSWLPLYHDMGLIGFVVAPIFTLVGVTFIPTSLFIRRPTIWLSTINRKRGTITFAPNFAYALATRSIPERATEGWDLTCLRIAGCGAEPISAQVLRDFTAKFSRVGFRETSLLPAYGMAEATLAVSFADLDRKLLTDRVDIAAIKDGEARPADEASLGSAEIVGCGKALRRFTLEIRGEDGKPLPERAVGEVHVQGPSIALGYYQNPEATSATFRDGWLATGDLGYMVGDEVFICGRKKDLLIIHGRNYFPQDIEAHISSIDGVRDAQAAAFTMLTPGQSEERLVVVAETSRGRDQHEALKKAISQAIYEGFGLVVGDLVLIRRGTLPKTSSGKVRRSETRRRLEAGELELAGEQTPSDGTQSASAL